MEYGVDSFDHSVSGKQTEFVDGGPEKRKIYVHRATMTDLKPQAIYSKLYNVIVNSEIMDFLRRVGVGGFGILLSAARILLSTQVTLVIQKYFSCVIKQIIVVDIREIGVKHSVLKL